MRKVLVIVLVSFFIGGCNSPVQDKPAKAKTVVSSDSESTPESAKVGSLIEAIKKDATTNAEILALIKAGANVNEKAKGSDEAGDEGWTPLHYATKKRDITIIKALVGAGADKTIRDKYGDLPMDNLEDNDQLSEKNKGEARLLLGS